MDGFSKFEVVINEEEQYSIWPLELEVPMGWRKVGISGTRAECLDYIKVIWKDITPKSVRERKIKGNIEGNPIYGN